jgi:hypothetical protein
VLTLLPEQQIDTSELAVSWLRGAHAALALLLGAAVERTTIDELAGNRHPISA